MKVLSLALVALLSLTSFAVADEFAGGDVVNLTSSNYDDAVRPGS